MPNLSQKEFLQGGDFKVMSPDEFLGGEDFIIEGQAPALPEKSNIFGRIGESIKTRFARAFEGTEAFRRGEQTFGEATLQTGGQITGLAGDILAEGVKLAGKGIAKVTPGVVEKGIKKVGVEVLKTPLGQAGLDALSQGITVYQDWKERNPRAARDLEAVVNIASVLPIGKGAQAAAVAGVPLAKQAAKATAQRAAIRFTKSQLNKIDNFIDVSIQKGIRPSAVGRATAPQLKAFTARSRNAVFTILENKTNLQFADETGELVNKLPESLKEFSEAIGQTKKVIFNQYDALTKQAGQKGAEVKLDLIAKELDAITSNPVLADQAPEVVSYAARRAEALRARGFYSPEQAQEAIEILNRNLDAFYKNPTYDNATKVTVDAMIANNLRKGLDDVVEGITGEQYQALKNQYGALKTIEKDVTKRAIVDARKNIKGLIDFSDIFSGSQVVYGVLTLSPAVIATGVAAKSIAAAIKFINNPNRIIKNMFQKVDRVLERSRKLKLQVRKP